MQSMRPYLKNRSVHLHRTLAVTGQHTEQIEGFIQSQTFNCNVKTK